MKNSGGSNGVLAGRSIQASDGAAAHPVVSGRTPVAVAGGDASGPLEAKTPVPRKLTPSPGQARTADEERFRKVERVVNARLAGDPTLKGLRGQIKFVRTRDGMRIDIVERADFSMFGLGTAGFTPDAARLVRTVAGAVAVVPNALTVRGHTDARPYEAGSANNWTLSSARADATRQLLTEAGIAAGRFRRIEGVAATDPFNPADPLDPRNRRISVTLLFREPPRGSL